MNNQPTQVNLKTALFIGNHFTSTRNSQNVYKEIPFRLEELGWKAIVTTQKTSKVNRLIDILWTIFSKRSSYQLAFIDVFSGSAFIWAELSSILIKILKKPHVLVLRGGNLPSFSTRHPKRVERILRTANVVISPSMYLKEELSKFRTGITVIPNPIEINAYSYRNRTSPRPLLVWIRAFHKIYNPSLVPLVLRELSKTTAETQITMIGPDTGDGSLNEMISIAKNMNVIEKIKLPGKIPRNQVPSWLNAGDIFINTTNFDNTPVSLIEAMASGLPIVTTDVGGIPYLLENDQEGLLVPPNDQIAMTEAILRLLTEPGLAGKISRNARKKVESYDWSIVLPQWKQVLEEVLIQK